MAATIQEQIDDAHRSMGDVRLNRTEAEIALATLELMKHTWTLKPGEVQYSYQAMLNRVVNDSKTPPDHIVYEFRLALAALDSFDPTQELDQQEEVLHGDFSKVMMKMGILMNNIQASQH